MLDLDAAAKRRIGSTEGSSDSEHALVLALFSNAVSGSFDS
jgi:hypothetical protein